MENIPLICDMKEWVNIRMVILKASKGTHFITTTTKNELIPFSQTDVLGQSPELKCLERNEKSATLARG